MDESFHVHYQSKTRADRILRKKAQDFLNQALTALGQGNLTLADRQAGHAISAQEKFLDARAVKVLIQECRGEASKAAVLRDAATTFCSPTSLDMLVEKLLERIPVIARGCRSDAVCKMKGIASTKPDYDHFFGRAA